MTSTRLTVGQLAQLRESMSDRDREILATLGRMRVATTLQLERLHFHGGTPLSNARVCRRTMERLTHWRVVGRLDRRIGGIRAGSAGFVYTLDIAGRRLLEDGRPARPAARGPSKPFLDHALAVSELYVQLVEAEQGGRIELFKFESEPACWRHFTGPGGETITVKADAFVRLATPEFIEHSFVEVDLATESARALTFKMDRYRQYWMTGREQAKTGAFPRVLWLVPNTARYKQLVDVASRQPAEAWQLFQVAEFANAISALGGGNG
jgi:hypothetical protein